MIEVAKARGLEIVEGLACEDPGARTPIAAIGNFYRVFSSDMLLRFPPPS